MRSVLDENFLKAVAKIESDFNPKNRTGSYIGLFQLSKGEFKHFGGGSGEITQSARQRYGGRLQIRHRGRDVRST